ncbi:MAG: GNAT family N-acetyltransferase [Limisphaerales bacterium]
MASVEIRPATPADAATIARFNDCLAQETERRALPLERLRQGVEAVLNDPTRGFYLVAESDSHVVGQVLLTYEWSDWRRGNFWWLQSVYVENEFRGQGVFKALFRQVQTMASSRNDVCGLRLYVDGRNLKAKAAYQRLGLRPTHYEVLELDFVLATV